MSKIQPVVTRYLEKPNTIRKERTYDVLSSPYKEKAEMVQKLLGKSDISKKNKHVWLSGRLHIEGRLNEGPRLQQKHKTKNEPKQKRKTS